MFISFKVRIERFIVDSDFFKTSCISLLLTLIVLFCSANLLKNKNTKTHIIYIIFYSVDRFILEFFRGDIQRGIYGLFSTSQIISLILFFSSTLIQFSSTDTIVALKPLSSPSTQIITSFPIQSLSIDTGIFRLTPFFLLR